MRHTHGHPVILFDGVCNLCNGLVRFVIRRDPRGRFRLAALQSQAGQRLLQRHGLPLDLDSFVLLENGVAYTRSTAALRVARRLGRPWSFAWLLMAAPAPLRDAVYKLIARSRYRIFGQRDSCMMPSSDLQQRFLAQ